MSYLQRLKNKNMSTIGTAKTAKSTIDPLFAVNAVPPLSIFEKTETPFYSFCSAHPKHISENEIPSQGVKETKLSPIDGLHPCPLCGGVLFNEGSRGGYFCVVCQGLPEGASVVRVVRGITPRRKKIYPNPEPLWGNETTPTSCWTCRHYDGRGSAWPGMCRYFETIGQAAQEIDFNVVDPVHGCGFFKPLQVAPIASDDRHSLRGDDPGWIPLDQTRQPVKRAATTRQKPSPVALAWLYDHRQALDKAGWTRAELYRRNKSRGIAWLRLWGRPDLQVSSSRDGSIIFSFTTPSGNQITQSASPRGSYEKEGLHQGRSGGMKKNNSRRR